MKWMRERDALIAQTLAFVQSVTGRKDAGDPAAPLVLEAIPTPMPPPAPAVSAASVSPEAPTNVPDAKPQPLVPGDVRSEMKSRIASFRAHQERFHREREEYFRSTLARLRAAIRDDPTAGPGGKADPH
jgi:hypothetical protein